MHKQTGKTASLESHISQHLIEREGGNMAIWRV